jgi:hypothetical protein
MISVHLIASGRTMSVSRACALCPSEMSSPRGDTGWVRKSDPVVAHLRQSRTLIVFTGPRAASHPWVDFELKWWLAHRQGDPVFLVLCHGRGPKDNRQDAFPKAVIQHGIDRGLWFDLRGQRGARAEER